ncbi:MFS transporter [Vibrio pectenicida]|uniref:MFS transporter n=1 Tax=Vibrio pectenicida TaxID=62763 RepID=A0A3R9F8I3_9VIBR|nr:MFS transporter [Vibrio pectenicida]RSD31283.1 MFS transporter [Vibrio pectenicida]
MSKLTTIFISILMASSYFFASSMYTPSFPEIQSQLNTSEGLIQQSLSLFFIALASSQLICGPLSERFGRKPVALMCSGVFVIGSIVCLISDNIDTLLLGRVIQGLGVGGLYLLCRTILQDVFDRIQLMGILSWYSVLFMSLPGLTLILGGYLTHNFSWKGNFVFMAILAIATLFVITIIKRETINHKNPDAIKPKQIVKDYIFISSNPKFLCYLAMMFSGTSCLLLFQVTGSFVAQNQFDLTVADYALGSMALIVSSVVSRLFWSLYLKQRISENMTLVVGCLTQVLGCIVTTLSLLMHSYLLMLVGFTVMAFGCAFLMAIAGVSALYMFPNHKGQVGAIYGALQMVGAFGFTFGLSLAPATHQTMVLASWILSLISISAFVIISLRQRTGVDMPST